MNTGTLRELERRIRRLERANPLSSSSLGRGRMRFYDGSELLIQNGALNVTGSATISGLLDVTGTTNLKGSVSVTGPMEISGTTVITGNTNITGELNVTGPTTLDGITDIGGDTTITGLLDITGDTTVDGNFEILGNGLFKAGVTQIEPNGKATFGDFIIDPSSNKLIQAPGGWLFSTGPGSIGLADSGTSSVNLNSVYAELNYNTARIRLTLNDTVISNRLTVEGAAEVKGNMIVRGGTVTLQNLPSATSPPNVFIDSSGVLRRTSWVP